MTVKKLKEILDTFPDNMNVMITYDRIVLKYINKKQGK